MKGKLPLRHGLTISIAMIDGNNGQYDSRAMDLSFVLLANKVKSIDFLISKGYDMINQQERPQQGE